MQGFFQWSASEQRHLFADEVDDHRRGVDSADATIGLVLLTQDHALLFKPVDDAADGGVGQTDFAAQVFEADAFIADDDLHGGFLRGGEGSTSELRLEGAAEGLSDDAQVALNLLGLGGDAFMVFPGGIGPAGLFHPSRVSQV